MAVSSDAPTPRTRIGSLLREELHPSTLVRSLATGSLIYILQLIITISFAALIFAQDSGSFVLRGLGFLLAGNAVMGVVLGLTSSWSGTISLSQDAPVAVLAATVAAIPLAANAGPEQQFATAMMLIIVATVATGLVFALLGILRLGGIARFVPFPVLGGFLAATGWFLLTGGLSVMTAASLGPAMLVPVEILRWLPGLILGAALLLALGRTDHPLALPVVILAAVALFYLLVAATGTTAGKLAADGWLTGAMSTSQQLPFAWTPQNLGAVDWTLLAGSVANIAPLIVVSSVGVLLNANALELVVRRDMDLNRELVAAGAANIAGGLAGTAPGYHAVSMSAVNQRLTRGKRVPALLCASLLVVTLLAGAPFLPYVPKFILGGILVWMGLDFLREWIVRAWFRFERVEFLIIVLIAAVIVWKGFLAGLGAGLLAVTGLFLVSYSRVSVVKKALSGNEVRSRVTRSPEEAACLETCKSQLAVLQLHGYIFFGTANRLYEQLRKQSQTGETRLIIFDFAAVTGMDATAILGFQRIRQLAEESGIQLVLAAVASSGEKRPALAQHLARGGLSEQEGLIHYAANLDDAVEWCEARLLAQLDQECTTTRSLEEHLAGILTGDQVRRLLAHMEYREVKRGEQIIRQGDTADDLYLLESGQLTAQLESPGMEPVRLETTLGGRMVGEIGFYLNIPRSAAVVASTDAQVYRLPRAALAQMQAQDLEALAALYQLSIDTLAHRVLHLTRSLEAALR